MKKNRHPQRSITELCCVRLQRQVVALFASVLVVSVIKIAYELTQTARSTIDQPNRAGGSSPPAGDTRHLSVHSPLSPPATSGDPGSELLARSTSLWPVSRGLSNSHVVRADMKINSSHTLHFGSGHHNYAPTPLPSFKARVGGGHHNYAPPPLPLFKARAGGGHHNYAPTPFPPFKARAGGGHHNYAPTPFPPFKARAGGGHHNYAPTPLLSFKARAGGGHHNYAPTPLPSFKGRAALSPQPWERPVKGVRKTQPLVVIVVCSKPENTELRLAIRRTWGLEVSKSQIVLRFFMGRDETWDSILTREQALHGDVVRTEHLDTYDNLSYKVLAALSWVLGNVKRATHIMKIDDDTYVSLPFLLQELRDNAAMQDAARKSVLGAVCVNSSVVRDDGDKWFVSALTYPSDVYPDYVFGGGYVLTKSAAEAIVAASWKTDYLHLEDVFITGILAKAAAVTLLSHAGFSFWTSKRPTPCDVVKGRRLTAASLTPKQFYALYSGIHSLLRTGNWTRC